MIRIKETLLYFYYRIIKSKYIFCKELKTINPHIFVPEKKKIFLFLAADYGNLGDVAITLAQRNFIKKVWPDYFYIEVPISKNYLIEYFRKHITSEDIITIVGGGNLGSLYYSIEIVREYIIRVFRRNKIYCFPQSIYFENSKKGKNALCLAQHIYKKASKLTIFIREEQSYKFCQSNFQVESFLVPDLVMTLDRIDCCIERENKAVICLRNDKEQYISGQFQDEILSYINTRFNNSVSLDTFIGQGNFDFGFLEKSFESFLKELQRSSFVITDRLHGMIFAYITGTPCVVLPNNNDKIKYSFEWIKDCGYIKFVDKESITEIKRAINDVCGSRFCMDAFRKRQIHFFELIKSKI